MVILSVINCPPEIAVDEIPVDFINPPDIVAEDIAPEILNVSEVSFHVNDESPPKALPPSLYWTKLSVPAGVALTAWLDHLLWEFIQVRTSPSDLLDIVATSCNPETYECSRGAQVFRDD